MNLTQGAELVNEIKSLFFKNIYETIKIWILLLDAERDLIEAIKKRKNGDRNEEEKMKFYQIYLRLGHINLLAEDFPKGKIALIICIM